MSVRITDRQSWTDAVQCVQCMQERDSHSALASFPQTSEEARSAHGVSVYLPTRVNRSAIRLDLMRTSIGASLQRSEDHTQCTDIKCIPTANRY